MSVKDFMRVEFKPALSWDGVAICIACATCFLWFGALRQTVADHSAAIERHEQTLKSLADGQQLISQNIAVLQSIVNERTTKGTK